jgi:sulfane dehydrogenase subunit SoxC
MENVKRRGFLGIGAALGGWLAGCGTKPAEPVDDMGPSRLGKPVSEMGQRSVFEKSVRKFRETKTPEAAASFTPLQDSYGILTPASLHFERHHSGVPAIDPKTHKLLIHGLVDRPTVFTVDEIHRLPSVTRIHFIECAGNSGSEWAAKKAPDAQRGYGLASCSAWTGVPLGLILRELGLKKNASWLVAEGADPCKMSRSIPLQKGLDDVLIAYGQNGEALRPEQGYPLRLVVPGFEGNINVKWIHRIKVTDQPYMTKDETSKYTDLLPDGQARQFTFLMDAKSVITSPSGGHKLNGAGSYVLTGLAWSGRGRIEKVEVTTDGGKTWQPADIEEPRLPQAFTRFQVPWQWDGSEVVFGSRATDQTGYVQPAVDELIAARGPNSNYHNNGIKFWKVTSDGNVQAA